MLSMDDNELLTQTGPHTPMGDLLRRFWTPVLLQEELPEPDCPPMRVKVLGENLVAFRDSNGSVGLLDQACPHRRASLFFGRNEECGLRCVYHGWKFDVHGNCVDMPSEPAESNFKEKVHITSYPTQEQGGIVWAYLGPDSDTPPMPELEWLLVPETHRFVVKDLQECNSIQAMEGDIDTVHAPFLHARLDAAMQSTTATTLGGRYQYGQKAPTFVVKDTDYGAIIGAYRNAEEDSYYWRISQWLMPFFTMIPREPGSTLTGFARVPMDDHNSWTFHVVWHPDRPLTAKERSINTKSDDDLDPGTFRMRANKDNDYLIDRQAQRTQSFSGIPYTVRRGGRAQDGAMVESMGLIADRTQEHLGTTDSAIIRMRRRLIRAARDLQEGIEPYPAQNAQVYRVRSGSAVLPRGVFFTDDPAVLESVTVR